MFSSFAFSLIFNSFQKTYELINILEKKTEGHKI